MTELSKSFDMDRRARRPMANCKHEGKARWDGLGWFVYCLHCRREKMVFNPDGAKRWMRKAIDEERMRG